MSIQGNENSFFTCHLKAVLDDFISHYSGGNAVNFQALYKFQTLQVLLNSR